MKTYSILFVCLGNICRSPVAAAIFRHLVAMQGIENSFFIDSCGTGGWHEGEQAHSETRKVAKARGITLAGHRARQVRREDFTQFDLIVAMDRDNLNSLRQFQGRTTARLICLREFDPERDDLDVPDPYDGGIEGFELVHDIVERSCKQLLEELQKELLLSKPD